MYTTPQIDIASFRELIPSRLDKISLRDADGNVRYKLVVVDQSFDKSVHHATCVCLNPPREPNPDERSELKAAAKRIGCVRMIGVDQRPPGVADIQAEKELHHVAKVLDQNNMFSGTSVVRRRHILKDVHYIYNHT
jgi:hypothetical protein